MKIGVVGLSLTAGKVKYHDPRLSELEKKISPKKTNPFFLELITDDLKLADAVCCLKSKVLDIIISDMEVLEKRLAASGDEKEKALLSRCAKALEKEGLLCDLGLSQEEIAIIKNLQLVTLKPVLLVDQDCDDAAAILKNVLDKAGVGFFYTTAKGELRGWSVAQGTKVLEAAGKIHSDLARGFIKAEVVNFADFISVHNMQEAKTKGKVKVVDKDYIVQDGDIIEIRFNV